MNGNMPTQRETWRYATDQGQLAFGICLKHMGQGCNHGRPLVRPDSAQYADDRLLAF